LGVLLLVVSALFGAVTVARVADREPVLAIAAPISRGEPVTANHLTDVRVGSDDDVALVPASEAGSLVGLRAIADLAPGTLVSLDHFTEGPSIARGQSVIGLALAPGEYPTANLAPGDRIVVVRTPPREATSTTDTPEPTILVDQATVFAIQVLSETAQTLMVSLTVPSDTAPELAAAAAAGRVRLVLQGTS
jgi:hypothetical protein